MTTKPSERTKLFISYSRKDRSKVERLYDALSAEDELKVFRDTDDILPTEEWKPRLEKLIRESDTIIFALSPQSAASEVCTWELELAESLNKRIIPVVVENVDGKVPEAVSKLNYIFLTEADDFGRALSKIQDGISLDIGWIREHTRLGELADRWDRAMRLGAQPLRGKELETAERWLVEQPKNAPQPTELQRRFILESRRSATRRARITVMSALAAMAVVGVLGVFSWMQRGEAIAQRNAALLVESEFLADAADTFLSQGKASKAIETLLAALPTNLITPERPVLQRAIIGLEQALSMNRVVTSTGSINSMDMSVRYSEEDSNAYSILTDGTILRIAADSGVIIDRLKPADYLDAGVEVSRVDLIKGARLAVVSGFSSPSYWMKVISLDNFSVIYSPDIRSTSGSQFDLSTTNVAWSENGQYLSHLDMEKGDVYLVDLASLQARVIGSVRAFASDPETGFSATTMAVSNDGKYVAVSVDNFGDTNLVLLSGPTYEAILLQHGSVSGNPNETTALAFKDAKDGRLLAGDGDGTLTLFDLATGRQSGKLSVASDQIIGIKILNGGEDALVFSKRVVTQSRGGNTYLVDISDFRYSPNGKIDIRVDQEMNYSFAECSRLGVVAVGQFERITLYDLNNNANDASMLIGDIKGGVASLDFNDDCSKLLVADANGAITDVLQLSVIPTLLAGSMSASPFGVINLTRGAILHSEYSGINGEGARFTSKSGNDDKTAIEFFASDDGDFDYPILGFHDKNTKFEMIYRPTSTEPTDIDGVLFRNYGNELIFSVTQSGKKYWYIWRWATRDQQPERIPDFDGAEAVLPIGLDGASVLVAYGNSRPPCLQYNRGATMYCFSGVSEEKILDAAVSDDLRVFAVENGKGPTVYINVSEQYQSVPINYSMLPDGQAFDNSRSIQVVPDGSRILGLTSVNTNNLYREELFAIDLVESATAMLYPHGYAYRDLITMALDTKNNAAIVRDGSGAEYRFAMWKNPSTMLTYGLDFVSRIRPLSASEKCVLHLVCVPEKE